MLTEEFLFEDDRMEVQMVSEVFGKEILPITEPVKMPFVLTDAQRAMFSDELYSQILKLQYKGLINPKTAWKLFLLLNDLQLKKIEQEELENVLKSIEKNTFYN